MKICTHCNQVYPTHKISCKQPNPIYRIPTSLEFVQVTEAYLEEHDEGGFLGIDTATYAEKLREFAAIIKNEALRVAAEKAKYSYNLYHDDREEKAGFKLVATKDSILNAYPDENIK